MTTGALWPWGTFDVSYAQAPPGTNLLHSEQAPSWQSEIVLVVGDKFNGHPRRSAGIMSGAVA